MDINDILNWAVKGVTSPLHLWFFNHPISIVGDGKDIGDRGLCAMIANSIRMKNRNVSRVL